MKECYEKGIFQKSKNKVEFKEKEQEKHCPFMWEVVTK